MSEAARPLRVLIADDEPLARQHVADRLAQERDVEIVGVAEDGEKAVEAIRAVSPDLVFLDIRMPGLNGFEVIEEIGPDRMPVVVFTTAYDQYALKAFEVAAVDYLVKPFDDERFSQAFGRARKAVESMEAGLLAKRLETLVDHPLEGPVEKRAEYLDRIPVESRGQLRLVAANKVDYITASGPYAELHVAGRTWAIRERMQALEEQLDPSVFMRVHRSVIVRLDRIDALLHGAGGDYSVRLKDGTELSVSRARREELERRMGVRR